MKKGGALRLREQAAAVMPHSYGVSDRLLYDTAFAILADRPFTEPDCTTGSVSRKGRQGKPKSGEVYY